MIESIGQVMLYVENVERSANFWKEKVGFEWVEKIENSGNPSYIVAPKKDSDVQFVLHDKAVVAKMNPEMNLGTPSILMVSQDLKKTHKEFLEKGIQASEIMSLESMQVFHFCDEEGQYFAVRQA